MRQYAILKNVARGSNFGIVVKSANVYKFLGWSEKGIEWSKWANEKKVGIESLPDGVSLGEFKELTDELMKKIIVDVDEGKAAGEAVIERKTVVFHRESKSFPNVSKFPSVTDTQLRLIDGAKNAAVSFKVKSFLRGVAQSEMGLNVRMNRLAFNPETKQFSPRPNNHSHQYTRAQIRSKISQGAERKFGRKINSEINRKILKTQFGLTFEREIVGDNFKSIVDYQVKSKIGRALGRVSRLAPSRRAGMRATRQISGVLDPMKRRDVDGDGMIFDGTWREMPDPSRFTRRAGTPGDGSAGGARTNLPSEPPRRPGLPRSVGEPPNPDKPRERPAFDISRMNNTARNRAAQVGNRRLIELMDSDVRTFGEPDELNREQLREAISKLSKLDDERNGGSARASAYQEALDRLNGRERRAAREGLRSQRIELPPEREQSLARPTGYGAEIERQRRMSESLQQALRNEDSARTRRRVQPQLSTRRTQAVVERASTPRGLRSTRDSGKEAVKGGVSFNALRKVLGRKSTSEADGKVWESLTPEQQEKVKEILEKRKAAIDSTLKAKHFKSYWAGQVRGAKKQSARAVRQRARGKGGRYEARDQNEPLTIDDVEEMFGILDREIDKGNFPKFKRGDDGKISVDEDGNAELDPKYIAVQRLLDDAMSILQMDDAKDYSLLEHLHPASRKMIGTELKKSDADVKLPRGFSTEESTAAGFAGGEAKFKPRTEIVDTETGETGGKKRFANLRSRILRVDPERERRVQLRAQRRRRELGRRGVILDPAKEMKRRKLRAAAFKRSVLSKFRREKDPRVLSDDLGIRRNELHPVQISPDGTVSLRPEFMQTIAALDKSFTDKSRDLSNDQLLADLWENLGYSEPPTLITEEEVKSLIEAGWQPVIRGTGNSEVESEGYVEQFLTSEGRFIPGRGARAYGVGEYFAYPGGNWTAYSGNPEVDRHSMLVLIPPSATVMTRSQVAKEQASMRNQTEKVVGALKTLGGRDATSKMEPGELAAEIRKSVPGIDSEPTRSAQIVSRLIERLEELDKIEKTDATRKETQDILDTFDYLGRVSKASEDGYFAPIIGVDAIDTNDGSATTAPFLLHNRSIVAAFQTPMTRNQAEAMSRGTAKVWDKWKRKPRIVDGDEAEAAPRRKRTAVGARKQRSPRRSNAATQAQGSSSEVTDTSTWRKSTPQSVGSNPATMLTAPDGTQYYAKLKKPRESAAKARQRMETEVLASELYKLAGVPTADLSLGDDGGEPQMLSRMIQARMPNSPADNDAARGGFVVDAWLANWDAPLNDNIKIDGNGNPVRLDVGGSLDYRAQGGVKGTGGTQAFGDTVGEIMSMQKSGTYDFTNIDPREIRRQARQLSNVTDQQIRETVSRIVGDKQRAAALAQTLINRRNDIVANYG
jgi:hypothetical protein